jgi:hypothetical protein
MMSWEGGGMRQLADLLHEALRHGDAQGRTQIRGKHLPERLFADLAAQTHRYALEHADGVGEGWLTFKEGIDGWWIRAGHLADGEFSRLYKLRTDVVMRLTEQGLAYRPNPRSTLLHVRGTAGCPQNALRPPPGDRAAGGWTRGGAR